MQCILCDTAVESRGSISCPGCGLSSEVLSRIVKRRAAMAQARLRALFSASSSNAPFLVQRKGSHSFLHESAVPEEAGFERGKVFVGLQFAEGGVPPPSYQSIRRVCARFGLLAERVFVAHPGKKAAQVALRAIEEAEFLIFDLTGGSANVVGELHYALACGNRFDWIVVLAGQGATLPFMVETLHDYGDHDLLRYSDLEDMEFVLDRAIAAKDWRPRSPTA